MSCSYYSKSVALLLVTPCNLMSAKISFMKKLLLLLIAVSTFNSLKAQSAKAKSSSGGSKCFNENTKIINIGVGFFGTSYYRYGRSGAYKYQQSPAISASYEHALPEKIGPGYIGVGAFIGYRTAYYRFDDYYYNNERYYYKHQWTYSFWALRAAYHLEDLCTDKGEVYFGSSIGIRAQKYRFETNSTDPYSNNYRLSDGSIWLGWSVFAGGRYYFTDHLGLYGELGYGITWFTLGMSIKL